MADIKVRGLDASVVTALDGLAKKQGKSRNEYLKEQLTLLAERPRIRQKEDQYKQMLHQVCGVVEQNTHMLSKLIELVDADFEQEESHGENNKAVQDCGITGIRTYEKSSQDRPV